MRCGSCNEVFDGNAALHDQAALPPLAANAALPPASSSVHADHAAAPAAPATEDQPYALDFDTSFDPYGLLPEYAQLKPVQPEELKLGPQWESELESELEAAPTLYADAEPPPPSPIAAEAAPEPEPVPEVEAQAQPGLEAELEPELEPEPEPELDPALAAPPDDDAVAESTATTPAPAPTDAQRWHNQDAPQPVLLRRSNDRRAEPSSLRTRTGAVAVRLARAAVAEEATAAPVETKALASDANADLEQLPKNEVEDKDAAAGEDEPGFVKQSRRRQRAGKMLHTAMAAGSVVLLITLLAQGATTFRNQLAAQVPQLKPVLVSLCSALGCRVELPAQIDFLSIEQGELQSLAERTFSYATVLRNTGSGTQSWPHLELTLDDASDRAVLRRVIAPRDYLPPSINVSKGFPPRSEQAVKLYFELAQLKAAGYHIAIFYP